MKKILLLLSLFVCTTMAQAKDLEVTGKHKVKQTTGLTLISKDDLWTMILLVGEKESCKIGHKWNGKLLTYGGVGAACVSMTNSSNTDIYCTPKKSICKTEKEILDFAQ